MLLIFFGLYVPIVISYGVCGNLSFKYRREFFFCSLSIFIQLIQAIVPQFLNSQLLILLYRFSKIALPSKLGFIGSNSPCLSEIY